MGKDWLRFDAQRRWAKGGGEGREGEAKGECSKLGQVGGTWPFAGSQGAGRGTRYFLVCYVVVTVRAAGGQEERLLGLTLGSTGRRWAEKPWKRGEERAPVRRV